MEMPARQMSGVSEILVLLSCPIILLLLLGREPNANCGPFKLWRQYIEYKEVG
jgi:hypothetical protein